MNHGTDNQKILGNCPSCQRLMQIPVVTDVASVAKCPHCENMIRVRDLLASAVPEAEIIADEKDSNKNNESDYVADRQRVYDESKPKTREKFEVPNQLYNGASRRNRKRRNGSRSSSSTRNSSSRGSSRSSSSGPRSGSSEGASNGKVTKSPSNGDGLTGNGSSVDRNSQSKGSSSSNGVAAVNGTATANSPVAANGDSTNRRTVQPRPPPKPVPRPRRSSSGRRSSDLEDEVEIGLSDVLKFLGGGAIAAPLAYLALLWVLGVDPFGMASVFESVSPSIIPESMRSEDFGDQPRSGFAPPAGDSSSDLFGSGADVDDFDSDFEDEGLPLPSLDPDLVR